MSSHEMEIDGPVNESHVDFGTDGANDIESDSQDASGKTPARRRPKRRAALAPNPKSAFKPDDAESDLEDHMVTRARASRAKSATPSKATPARRATKPTSASTGRAKQTQKRKSSDEEYTDVTRSPAQKRARTRKAGAKPVSVAFPETEGSLATPRTQIPDRSIEAAIISGISSLSGSFLTPITPAGDTKPLKPAATGSNRKAGASNKGTPLTPTSQRPTQKKVTPKSTASKKTTPSRQPSGKKTSPSQKGTKRQNSDSTHSEYRNDENEEDDEEDMEVADESDATEPPQSTKSPPRTMVINPEQNYQPTTESEKDPDSARLHEPKPERVYREVDVDALHRAGQARLAAREQQRDEEFADLTQQEYDLFAMLDHRGYESFMPAAWHLDFPFGNDYYYSSKPETTHIRPVDFQDSNANFRAMTALKALMNIGPTARDRFSIASRRPEPFIARKIRKYRKWAYTDGKNATEDSPEMLSVAFDNSPDGLASTDSVLNKLEQRMLDNARHWQEWYQRHTSAEVIDNWADRTKKTHRDSARHRRLYISGLDDSPSLSPSPEDDHDGSGENVAAEVHEQRRGWLASLKDRFMGRPRAQTSDSDNSNDGNDHSSSGAASSHEETEIATPSSSSAEITGSAETTDAATTTASNNGSDERERPRFPIQAVYGIAVMHLVVVILSLPLDRLGEGEFGGSNGDGDDHSGDSSETTPTTDSTPTTNPTRRARVLFYVDFSKPAEDVWSSVAIAMAVCHCRDLQLKAVHAVKHQSIIETDDGDGEGQDEVGDEQNSDDKMDEEVDEDESMITNADSDVQE